MSGTYGQNVYCLGRRKKRALAFVIVKSQKDRLFAPFWCCVLKRNRGGEIRYGKTIENIARADEKQDPVAIGEIIKQSPERAHHARKRTPFVAERKIN